MSRRQLNVYNRCASPINMFLKNNTAIPTPNILLAKVPSFQKSRKSCTVNPYSQPWILQSTCYSICFITNPVIGPPLTHPSVHLTFLMCFHGNCRHQYMPSLTSADIHCLQSNYTSPRGISEGLANLLISSKNSLGSSPVHKSHNTDLPTRGIGARNAKFWQAHTLQSEVFHRGLGRHTNRHPLIHLYYLPTGKLYSGLRFCPKKNT